MLLSTKFEEFFMMNSNYGKTYNTFAEHPLAPIYFKYIDLLISRDLNQDVHHLLDIAHAPMTVSACNHKYKFQQSRIDSG